MAADAPGGVKASVEYVCNLLALLGAPEVSPETLRQAKFNSPTAADKLWPVVHALVLLELAGFPDGDISERLSDLWCNLDLEGQHEEAAAFVQFYLGLWGCPLRALPAAESFESTQSRDLLIALGWLIAHTGAFPRGLALRIARLRKSSPPDSAPLPAPSYPVDTAERPEVRNAARQAHARVTAHVDRVKEAGLGLGGGAKADALVNQALTLYGRLRSELGALASFQACQAKRQQELFHTQLDIRAKTAEAAAAAGVKTPLAPPLYGLYEMHLLRKRTALEAHEKALNLDESIHTAASECARHEALFWQWMESVVDERDSGGQFSPAEPPPRNADSCRFPSLTDLVVLASQLDLRIEDAKREHKGGGENASGSRGVDEAASQIEEVERWLREKGWGSYDALFESVLEQAGISGEAVDAEVSIAPLPDDIQALVGESAARARAAAVRSAEGAPRESLAVRPSLAICLPVTKDGRNASGKAGAGDAAPTAPQEIDRLMKLALSSARELARTRADNRRTLRRMLSHLGEDESIMVHATVDRPA